jgi:peptide/nickel transport system permease protein
MGRFRGLGHANPLKRPAGYPAGLFSPDGQDEDPPHSPHPPGHRIVFGVTLVTFFFLHLTGDPVGMLLPADASREEIQRVAKLLGFDQPIYIQFIRFMAGAVRGNFGNSIRQDEPALGLVLERVPATLELTLAAMVIAVLIAFPAGIISASRRGGWIDQGAMLFALIGQSVPV